VLWALGVAASQRIQAESNEPEWRREPVSTLSFRSKSAVAGTERRAHRALQRVEANRPARVQVR
jgi:hypothetical protein